MHKFPKQLVPDEQLVPDPLSISEAHTMMNVWNNLYCMGTFWRGHPATTSAHISPLEKTSCFDCVRVVQVVLM